MPTYEYACETCGHKFDAFQSMKDEPLQDCPECGRKSLKRLIGTGAGIIFKGNGFYCTDYRSDSYDKARQKDKQEPASKTETSGTKETAKTESTKSPAAKSAE